MSKNKRFFYFIYILLILTAAGCGTDDVDNNSFTVPDAMLGTWIPPDVNPQYIKLTLSKNNIIEENYEAGYEHMPYVDYRKEYSSDEFVITAETIGNAYEFSIVRKDGGIIDERYGLKTIFRKYLLRELNGSTVLELQYAGTTGAYLIKE